MQLASFRRADVATYGAIVDGTHFVDLGARFGDRFPTLRDALAGGALPEFRSAVQNARPDGALQSVTLQEPIPDARVICIGKNYRAHVAEGAGEAPPFPSVFIRLAASLVAHEQPIRLSPLSSHYDYEGELAIVIGTGGRHIRAEKALDHIAGFTCFNEACYRDFQFKHSLTVGKNFAASGSFGPWMTTADEVPDYRQLQLSTRLNGNELQHASLRDLIFDIPYLISYLSDMTPLLPGDVISTGTPDGVGFARKPPLWLKAGDVVEVEISNIGVLRNHVVPEA